MAEPRSATPLFRRILREPTSHFVLLAAVLFAANAALESWRGNVITIDPVQISVRIAELEAIRGAPLSPEERQLVEDAYIDEQVLVREALDMGLEADRRIDDILVQKMLHVLSGDVIQPTEDELREFYEANRASYTPESTLTIEEVVIAGDSPAAGDLEEQLRAGGSAQELAESPDVRSSVLREVTGGDLRRLFGPVTAELILSANTEGWIGPHGTVRGQHWFRIVEQTTPELPPLDSVRERVRLDWVASQEAARLDQAVRGLRERYNIVIEESEGR
ncbi:MAG: peptidylprolyl isomerase [Gammaproteobacteria bacterium]|nr:peptidylprolyl isomerase [Gammaproteobacteria bacterium]